MADISSREKILYLVLIVVLVVGAAAGGAYYWLAVRPGQAETSLVSTESIIDVIPPPTEREQPPPTPTPAPAPRPTPAPAPTEEVAPPRVTTPVVAEPATTN